MMQFLANLQSLFPWLILPIQQLIRLVTSTMADLGSLLFQSSNEADDEPNPDELFISDSLTPQEKLSTFSKSDLIIHRLFVLKDLDNIMEELGSSATTSLVLPVLSALSEDTEPVVRSTTMERVPSIVEYLLKNDSGEAHWVVTQQILPIVRKLLVDKNVQTQVGAHEALVKVAEMLGAKDLEHCVFSMISELLGESNEEDYRVEALALLKDLVPSFARHGLVFLIRPKVHEVCDDSSFRVRKGCVEVIAPLCQHLTPNEVSHKILPMFQDLSHDKIWGVRKAAAIALADVSKSVPSDVRTTEIMQIFEHLNEDVSRWVKSALLEHLGPFIASFLGSNEVPATLVDSYERMASGEADLVLACAFNFPAVVLTLGPQKWGRLKSTFQKLSGDMQWKVRRTLSFSLHELAKVIGPEQTDEDLVPVFELFLKDIDDVKIGVSTNYAKFISQVNPSSRAMILSKTIDFQTPVNNWRFRQLLASQLSTLTDLCEPADVKNLIVPQCLNFCRDSVSAVRTTTIPCICHLLKTFKARGPEIYDDFVDEIKKLGVQPSFSGRQFFAIVCGDIAETVEPQEFAASFFPLLVALSNDPVVNVRLSVAETLGKLKKIQHFASNDFVLSTLDRLKQDKDKDVGSTAAQFL